MRTRLEHIKRVRFVLGRRTVEARLCGGCGGEARLWRAECAGALCLDIVPNFAHVLCAEGGRPDCT